MQAHYSAASRLAYITQSNKSQVHVGLATQCLTNVYRWWRYKRITAVVVTQNISYDSNCNISLTIMFLFFKKRDHQGITNIMSRTGPNVMFEII